MSEWAWTLGIRKPIGSRDCSGEVGWRKAGSSSLSDQLPGPSKGAGSNPGSTLGPGEP